MLEQALPRPITEPSQKVPNPAGPRPRHVQGTLPRHVKCARPTNWGLVAAHVNMLIMCTLFQRETLAKPH